jgi:hypothetical protein
MARKDHLVPLVEAGVRGFKCFLIDSGVEVRGLINPLRHGKS